MKASSRLTWWRESRQGRGDIFWSRAFFLIFRRVLVRLGVFLEMQMDVAGAFAGCRCLGRSFGSFYRGPGSCETGLGDFKGSLLSRWRARDKDAGARGALWRARVYLERYSGNFEKCSGSFERSFRSFPISSECFPIGFGRLPLGFALIRESPANIFSVSLGVNVVSRTSRSVQTPSRPVSPASRLVQPPSRRVEGRSRGLALLVFCGTGLSQP
jgi:hypothetical protein